MLGHNRLRTFLTACSALWLTPVSDAQQVPATDSKMRWEQRSAELAAISFRLDSDESGEGASTAVFSGVCTLVRSEAAIWQMHLSGELKSAEVGQRVLIVFDGVNVRAVKDEDKSVLEKTISDLGDLKAFLSGQGVAAAVPWELMDPSLDDHGVLEPQSVTIDGTICEVLLIRAPPDGNASRLFHDLQTRILLARESGLPVMIERSRSQATPSGDTIVTRRINFSDVKSGEATVRRPFVIDAPDGYRIRIEKRPKRVVSQQPPERKGILDVGTPAPEWTLKDSNDSSVSLAELRGSVVILDFWATWCGPCRAAMPHVQKIHEDYESKGVRVFGLNCWERGDAKAFMTQSKYTYGLLLDGDKVAEAYGVTGIPTFYIIDQEGKIAFAAVGMAQESALRSKIDELLAK